ncbi:energy-coupling factor transporter transmembrane component T family protein [Psychrobacillus sp. NPDC096426]|uniref:energy-coupling factor transporter transmembrane component T family protein n=1 Tax=Psychrobacillus sp. NPDC096426 TaxID=3364491 RepID=UPI003826AEEF
MDYARSMREKLSVEYVKEELLKTAYGNGDTFLARLDPRTLIGWYLFFGVVPWFLHNRTILTGLLLFTICTTIIARTSPLILIILCTGLLSEIGFLFIISLFFGGGFESVTPMFWLTVKLAIISLASISVFSSIDPEKFSDGLLSLGMPAQVSFSIAFGYRILPTLMEEFHQIFLSYRLRGKAPHSKGFLYWRSIYYFMKILIMSFYPLILNGAKRSRTTVEALETKGFSYSASNPKVKKLKLAYMSFTNRDYFFTVGSIVYVLFVFWIGTIYQF